ncbi:MAG: aldo/keto reductase [bacterium]
MTSSTATAVKTIPSLATYSNLGRSGLKVSPLCLGTMTFGTEWGWGSAEDTAREILFQFLDSGGNFIDTADGYTSGTSETMIGKFLKDAKRRDTTVIATKFTFPTRVGDPNGGGNNRRHILEAVNDSLRRLQTDYIDLYWLHCWDATTPVEEVVYTLDTLVRDGKIRYWGLSDVPAWYLARAWSIAEARGTSRPIALQLEYSLAMRNIEHEYIDAAHEFGLGITPWSPLASGLLSGKYRKTDSTPEGEGRLITQLNAGNPAMSKFTDRNWAIVDALVEVADTLGKTPAQVALNWVTMRPGVGSTIIGATKPSQLADNLGALEFTIPAELHAQLTEASAPVKEFPYTFFDSGMQKRFWGDLKLQQKPSWW